MYITKFNTKIYEKDLKFLVSQYKFGRYCEDKSLSLESSRLLLKDKLIKILKDDTNQNIAVYDLEGNIQGFFLFKESPWDTEHFGYNVGTIDYIIIKETEYSRERKITKLILEKFNNWCKVNKIRFVSVKIPYLNLPVIHEFEQDGFNYIESWIYSKYDLKQVSVNNQSYKKLRHAVPEDCDIMIQYAKNAFSTQRFHADNHIETEKAESLYKKWIITAFEDPKQDIIVLDDIQGMPVAFMIYYIYDLGNYFDIQFAMWKMALVNPEKINKGFGYDFIKALFQFHKIQGLDIVDSGLSIRNLASLNWHNKLNFKIISTLVTFHKWYK